MLTTEIDGPSKVQSRRYTYSVVTVGKVHVDRVNACLLNEVTLALSFRTPAQMIRTIRQWRKYGRQVNWNRVVLPPQVPRNLPSMFGFSFEQYERHMLADLDPLHLARMPTYLDALEKELKEEINRTHSGIALQTGEIGDKMDRCWTLEASDQPSRLSWRRSGRQRQTQE